MLFSSMTFIYIFLPIVLVLYFLLGKKCRNLVLLISSLIFYAWGEPTYVSIMLCVILVNYIGGLLIEKYWHQRKILLLFTVLANLAFLIYFKYFNFLITNINAVFKSHVDFIHVVLPIGISFYTFQALSYVIDLYRGKVPAQKSLYKLALYITLFPQLVAGPVLRYSDIAPQIEERTHSLDKITVGVQRFIIGLSKKVLLANVLGEIADKVFMQSPDAFTPLTAWLGVVSYMMQIYYDFSGYSDMAIGLGLIFGFKFAENFNHPFYSKSATETWQKWHITVSSWFKDYVFCLKWYKIVPKFIRESKFWNRFIMKGLHFKYAYINTIGVFFLIGLWHGASWTFAAWGLFYGILIVFEYATGWNKDSKYKIVNFVKYLYVIFFAIIGFVLFRSDNFAYAFEYYKSMFGLLQVKDVLYSMSYYIDTVQVIALIVGAICCTPLFAKMIYIDEKHKFLKICVNVWLLVLFVLSTTSIAVSTYNPFIYFRF